jgi:hypothetical protein
VVCTAVGRAHVVAVVVVDAERVDGGRDDLEVARPDDRLEPEPEPGEVGEHVVGVGAAEDRVQEEAVELPVDAARGVPIRGIRRVDRVGHGEVEGDAELQPLVAGAELARREAVGEQEVVAGGQSRGDVLPAGRVLAADIAEERGAPGLVERGPGVDAVAEGVVDDTRVVGETVGGVAVRPTAEVLERLREIPVVEGEPRLDVVFEELVDEPRVEVDPLGVDRAAVGAHP